MASSTTIESVDKVSLRVMVDKERNKVLYAEAGNDFVDALFSFLTLPLGTIARLVAKESNIEAVKFGSISSLYQSVADLNEQHLWSHRCKQMLLKPIHHLIGDIRKLKLNIDDTTDFTDFFFVDICCRCVSIFRNQKCLKHLKVYGTTTFSSGFGFVKENATFIIQDDLYVMPNDLGTSLCLLQKQGINNIADIEKRTLLIGKKEVVDILKLSLLSKTPLTDFVFKKKQILCNSNPNIQPAILRSSDSHEGKKLVVKVLRRKSNRKILFATAGEDFADFLFSFLTLPLRAVLQMLEGFSSISCIHSLYSSIKELSPERCLRSQQIKDQLAKPKIYSKFDIKKGTLTNTNNGKLCESVDAKGQLSIMVTDDLVVIPMSSIDCISYLERLKVPLNDVEEMVVSIGLKEGLSILNASLTSTSVLTTGLNPYIGTNNLRQRKNSTGTPIRRSLFARILPGSRTVQGENEEAMYEPLFKVEENEAFADLWCDN